MEMNKNIIWEGAELCVYINDETNCIDLSDIQFAVIGKILGLEINPNGEVSCFSDETLLRLMKMSGNPLKLTVKKK
ncbi:hypothetical protein EXD82_10030 [Peptacetobacter hominis]|uniref:Uncharacterized protein n=1 Tax=Peptacetobacter hominis TaxID=2743610 RepID=A0A544QSW5_9FIRM|nr:hypothetical protein [Peptacetobacter hominis]TQQ83134.1 hypothetical protein EXD82_10030 [Peptacetobacter hominis]